MSEKNIFYTAEDIAKILNISKPTAYRIIKCLNVELKEKGFM